MSALAPVAPRLSKLLPLLASDNDGEVVATARAIDRTLRSAGLTWFDLAAALADPGPSRQSAPPRRPPLDDVAAWRGMAGDVLAAGTLTPRQASFAASMSRARRPLTARQAEWLHDLWMDHHHAAH